MHETGTYQGNMGGTPTASTAGPVVSAPIASCVYNCALKEKQQLEAWVTELDRPNLRFQLCHFLTDMLSKWCFFRKMGLMHC